MAASVYTQVKTRSTSCISSHAHTAKQAFVLLATGAICGLLALSATGCASVASASNSAANAVIPAQQLAASNSAATDRSTEFSPDVSNSSTISRTIYLDGDTAKVGDAEDEEASSYTLEISIDPYAQLWDAQGTVTDVNHDEKTMSVRLTEYETGHFNCQDVLLSYADYLNFNEYNLHKGDKVTFQYLLTQPMHTPLQAYNVKILS